MKKVTLKAVEPKPESDKAKRVYRTAVETIRRLDEIGKQKKAYREVFMPEAIALRHKLLDLCERLMFYDPLEYGRKAEELLWRKVYYDVIQLMKHNRKQMRPSSSLEGAFRTHLAAATGYYHHLLSRLQADCGLFMHGVLDFYYVADPKAYLKPHQPRKAEPDTKVKEWATRATHRCLVSLGDLARYQQDYDGMRSRVMAQRYYYQALLVCAENGMPHNQLGTLAGGRDHGLDACYHYLRCLCCVSPFDGARGNVTRLLEKNRRRHQELTQKSPRDLTPSQQRTKVIKRFIVRFLHLMDIFHCSKAASIDSKSLQEACQSALQDFNLCMFYQPPHVRQPSQPDQPPQPYASEDRLTFLEDDVVLKVTVICMITIHLLQKDGNKRVTAAIAFSLALFSHILNHVMIRLESALYELENPRRLPAVDSGDDRSPASDMDDDGRWAPATSSPDGAPGCGLDSEGGEAGNQAQQPGECHVEVQPAAEREDGGKSEKRKQRLKKMRQRRRRRRSSQTSTGSEDANSSDDSDLSEGCATDEDVDLQYLKRVTSSDSDSDDSNLMVSQEMRPGFLAQQHCSSSNNAGDGGGGGGGGGGSGDLVPLGPGPALESLSSSLSSSFSSSLLHDLRMLNAGQRGFSASGVGDLLHYGDLLGDSQGQPDQSSDPNIKAIVQGIKDVRVPPGFEMSAESLHVKEITQKMADFVIETDTDTSNMPTDTDNSTIATESEMDTEVETDSESVIDRAELERQRLERLLSVITNENLLLSIHVYCDWMRCNPHIIATCAKSSQSLWSRLAVLLNFLPTEEDLHSLDFCKSEGVTKMVEEALTRDWEPVQPLTEDIHLQEFPPLHDAHTHLVFEPQKRLDISCAQEAVLRVCLLRRFGYYISKLKSIHFTYDAEKSTFCGSHQQQKAEPPGDEKPKPDNAASVEKRRQQLMRDMAQLRLQAEVSQLEGSLQPADQANLPLYLVPEASALSHSLPHVRQLAHSGRFILLIPLAVIDHLDLLKKESSGAREAIRWLESEFKKGNRYVRAQKAHERTNSTPLKTQRRKDREALRFLQIVDCSKYVAQQSADCDSRGLVSILTNQQVKNPDSLRTKQAIQAAQQEGICVENAADFHSRWREVTKSDKG